MNWGILKSQKLLYEITNKLKFKSATKSEINCPMNVGYNAQIVLKRIFQARPANAHVQL